KTLKERIDTLESQGSHPSTESNELIERLRDDIVERDEELESLKDYIRELEDHIQLEKEEKSTELQEEFEMLQEESSKKNDEIEKLKAHISKLRSNEGDVQHDGSNDDQIY